MIIAHHLIWTVYGWWLPNDPRGSTSRVVRNDVLRELGELHFGRKQIQPSSKTIRDFYGQAQPKLKHELLPFSPTDIKQVGESFRRTQVRCNYTVWACAIMDDHVHLLVRKHRDSFEDMIEHFCNDSQFALRELGHRPPDHPVWTKGAFHLFLDQPEEVWRTIDYINLNPPKARMADQHWPFITDYDNWPIHPGSNPKSPYARRKHGEPF